MENGTSTIGFVSSSCAFSWGQRPERMHEDPFQAIFGPLPGSTFSEGWVDIFEGNRSDQTIATSIGYIIVFDRNVYSYGIRYTVIKS